MKILIRFSILFLLLLQGCSTQALRDTEKFSHAKKYAVLPFNCPDRDYARRLSDELKDWLISFDYDIISQDKLDALLQKSHLTLDEIVKNYQAAINKLQGVDGIIVGTIYVGKVQSKDSDRRSTGASGSGLVMSGSQALAVDLTSGDILARASYGYAPPSETAKRLALQLSPH